MPKLCDFLPPRDIMDVLHAAEAAGVKIPRVVDNWWKKQTVEDCFENSYCDVGKSRLTAKLMKAAGIPIIDIKVTPSSLSMSTRRRTK